VTVPDTDEARSARRRREGPEDVTRSLSLRIRLLGGFRVSVGSRSIEGGAWRLRKAAGLIKLLALAPRHRLPRGRATELLWPGSDAKTASNNLRGALHAARKALDAEGAEYLISEDGALLLCPQGDLWVDTEAFEEAASTARRYHNPAAYRVAIDLYAGELLPEDRFEDWAEEERADLRRLYLDLLTELAELYREQGEHDRAIEALQKVVAEEPTEEEAHASLMRLYALSGRQGEALAQYERLGKILAVRLDAQPAAEIRRLRKDIADGRLLQNSTAVGSPEPATGEADHNLPVFTTSFVDREREVLEVKRELAMTRLLTLTGPGGSGKTRLALEVAHDLVGAYPDGVWLVELAPLSEPGLVVQEVAGVLGIQERSGEPLFDTLVDELRSKLTLIVVDNCEHLLDGVAPLVHDLLRFCPELRLLATSREALGVPGEIGRPVPPLSLPDPGMTIEELGGYGAARLFVDRALYRPAAFALTSENAGAVAEVCRQLEGVPLAIELAAARVGVLAVEQISERLSASLKVLTGGGRTLTSRQRTLRGSLDWSHALLDEPEKRLFARLSVFTGGWTTEAAEAVCSGEGVDRDEVSDLLGALVGKSLVAARTGAEGAVRYRMLEIIRQYAHEKLDESGESGETRGRHAAFFLALAEEAGPELEGPQQGPWAEHLEREHDNLRAALSWVLDREEGEMGLRFGAALWRFWYSRGYLGEGIRWMGRVLAGGGPTAERLDTLEGMGWLAQKRGDVDRARATYEEMLELSRKSNDGGSVATALNSLGTLAASTGDNAQAKRYLEENLSVLERLEEEGYQTTLNRHHAFNLLGLLALNEDRDPAQASALWKESLSLARETGDALRIGTSLCCLGYAAVLQGENKLATELCEEALAYADEHDDASEHILPETLINLGLAALGQGDYRRAISSFERALTVSQPAGRKSSLMNALEGMASLSAARETDTRAARLWGAAEAGRESTGIALPPGDRALHEPYLASTRSRLGEAKWEEALSEGRALSLDEAAVYALDGGIDRAEATISEAKPSAHDEPVGKLTRREREVVTLVARGLTNRQLSTELSISERTAGNHVARILRKLHLHSRTQIATWATEQGLLGPEQN
jgi:predicted ATPase/DNA-binding SARP family transcriptional activator/DNA-binding CsgD family transcriptional regulator